MAEIRRTFTSRSLLYWLSGAFAIGLVLMGFLALLSPAAASIMFGIPAEGLDTLVWVRLAGVRDVALGLLLIAVVVLKQGRTAGILILLVIVVPLTDCLTVVLREGLSSHALIHASAIPFMLFLGSLLLRRG
jgi:hypothetical protein